MNDVPLWVRDILANRSPLDPIGTDVEPDLRRLGDIRAVVFDVYGTLVISGSGDVGTVDRSDRGLQIRTAFEAIGLPTTPDALPSIDQLQGEIRDSNDALRSETCPKPEVDIVQVWRRILARQGIKPALTTDVARLAAGYESLANPTWPMPGAGDLMARLRAAGVPMGIVSNAQIFTPWLVVDLLDADTLQAGGFELDLCLFSNRFRQSKPGPRLFDVLREALARRGISPHQAVYVGNDMLNDVWAASQAGLRTVWFAGDTRSCRPRSDDPRCRSLRPDAIVTNLMQLLDCLEMQ